MMRILLFFGYLTTFTLALQAVQLELCSWALVTGGNHINVSFDQCASFGCVSNLSVPAGQDFPILRGFTAAIEDVVHPMAYPCLEHFASEVFPNETFSAWPTSAGATPPIVNKTQFDEPWDTCCYYTGCGSAPLPACLSGQLASQRSGFKRSCPPYHAPGTWALSAFYNVGEHESCPALPSTVPPAGPDHATGEHYCCYYPNRDTGGPFVVEAHPKGCPIRTSKSNVKNNFILFAFTYHEKGGSCNPLAPCAHPCSAHGGKCVRNDAGYECQNCTSPWVLPVANCNGQCDSSNCRFGSCHQALGCKCFEGSVGPECKKCKEGYDVENECKTCDICYDHVKTSSGFTCQRTYDRTNCSACGCPGDSQCRKDGTCGCEGHFVGDLCNECAPDYYGVNCSVQCHNDTTCTDHGYCHASTGECVCAAHAIDSSNCESCENDYYGHMCDTFCVANDTCHARGSCAAKGGCTCSEGWADADDCNSCATNYFPPFNNSNAEVACANFCDSTVKCHGHGKCDEFGNCVCYGSLYEGATCSVKIWIILVPMTVLILIFSCAAYVLVKRKKKSDGDEWLLSDY